MANKAQTTTIAVFTEAPIPGRCLRGLVDGYSPQWTAGLLAAMLRDTLDGLLAIEAERHLVYGLDLTEEERALLSTCMRRGRS